MGKKVKEGDDWHFDIQHISAQTRFIRQQLKENFVVIYLENNYKSWPAWKQHHPDFKGPVRTGDGLGCKQCVAQPIHRADVRLGLT